MIEPRPRGLDTLVNARIVAGTDIVSGHALSLDHGSIGAGGSAEATRIAACPALLLGQADERGRIARGLRADLVLLDDRFERRATWIGSQIEWIRGNPG